MGDLDLFEKRSVIILQETTTTKTVKREDDGDVFHNVARADSVIEEKEEAEDGEDRDSCKIKMVF